MAVAVAALTFRERFRFAPARQGPLTHAHLVGHHGLGQPLLLALTSLLVLLQTLVAAALSGGLRSASSRRIVGYIGAGCTGFGWEGEAGKTSAEASMEGRVPPARG